MSMLLKLLVWINMADQSASVFPLALISETLSEDVSTHAICRLDDNIIFLLEELAM